MEENNIVNPWVEYIDSVGEQKAKEELARQLRMAADFVESPGYPDVYAASMMSEGAKDLDDFIGTISVTLSYPWPG